MTIDRRTFLKSAAVTVATAGSWPAAFGADAKEQDPPIADLHERFGSPVRIKSIDAVRLEDRLYVRATADNGAVGVAADNGKLLDMLSLLKRRVIPFFHGRDARDLEKLLDGIYAFRSNYKFAGMPFWSAVGYVELSLWDLLGRMAQRPAGELIAAPRRKEIPVYVTRLTRDTSPEEEVAIVEAALAETGAGACKLKIGGRLKNDPEDVRRTNRLVPLARKRLGDEVAIYVDANGSYSAAEAIEVGRMLETHDVGFFEEPCPWEEYQATKRVADALDMTVAGGEQDSSLARWRWMIGERAVDLAQPDLYYNGGLIRCLRVARMAERAGRLVTPHSPKTGAEALPMLQFASIVPNLGPHQEFRATGPITAGRVKVPTTPGLGHDLDTPTLRRAEPI